MPYTPSDQEGPTNPLHEAIERALALLAEHADNVQIFVSKTDTSERGERLTYHYNAGKGNFFALYGQVSLWLSREKARDCTEARRDAEEL